MQTDGNNGHVHANATRLNPELRNGLGIGRKRNVINSAYGEERNYSVRWVGESAGTTPFNIQCLFEGACEIRKILLDGDDTTVIFADGDRVCLHRNGGDSSDPATAVLWALGKKVFGKGLGQQIRLALKRSASDMAELRSKKKAKRRRRDKSDYSKLQRIDE